MRELTYCDCAGCGRVCLGDSFKGWYARQSTTDRERVPAPVAGRILGRPYCKDCLASPSHNTDALPPPKDESPWQQNAVRALEET